MVHNKDKMGGIEPKKKRKEKREVKERKKRRKVKQRLEE